VRVTAHRLQQLEAHDAAVRLFERVARLRPEEPQSPRDLALALAARADATSAKGARARDYDRAVGLLYDIVLGNWDGRFPEVETIALDELNRILAVADRARLRLARRDRVDPRLVKLLDVDLRVVMTWDTDGSDMDLWVMEPGGERCYYAAPLSAQGGHMSSDFTGGYGPEEYLLRRARPGTYAVRANFFGSRSQQLLGTTTVQATVFTDYGRPTERRQALTLRLADERETYDVGSVTIGDGPAKVRR
jgi:Ca-activated chloride channel homolog